MAKYFKSKLVYFHKPEAVKIKPKSEISCHITLTVHTIKCNKWFILP